MSVNRYVQLLIISLSILGLNNSAFAQIIPDATLPNNSSVINLNNINKIEGGTQAGNNLFHSFQEFSLPKGTEAFFNNATNIQNLITRVTGKSISNIDGLIRANGSANLFLINPNGVVFGENASLNIGGSFLASTANSFKFSDGGEFKADTPQNVPLLSITAPIGLQFNGKQGNIVSNNNSLKVQPGKTLVMVGDNISLNNSKIEALDGHVDLAGVKGAGEVGLLFNNNILNITIPSNLEKTDISLANNSFINVANQGVGHVTIASHNLNMSGNSRIIAGIGQGVGTQNQAKGDINIRATGKVQLTDNSLITNTANRASTGNAGNINIAANTVQINGGRIATRTLGQGDAGNINIQAAEISIDNPAYQMPGRNSNLEDKPAIDAGNYKNDSDSGYGFGKSGNISLVADGNITLIGQGKDRENKVISIYSRSGGKGGGSISLQANGSILVSNAHISSPSFNGERGDISIYGREAVSIVDNSLFRTGTRGKRAGDIKIQTQGRFLFRNSFFDAGVGGDFSQAGDITVQAGEIFVTQLVSKPGQGAFFAASNGKGYSGRVFLEAQGVMTLVGNDINTDDVLITTFANTQALGGGDVSLKANSISLNNAYLKTASERGNGGNITVLGKESVSIANNSSLLSGTNAGKGGNITVQSSGPISISQSLLLSGVGGRNNLNAIGGDIDINGSSIYITDGSEVTARASREAVNFLPGGTSGNIRVTATDEVVIKGRASYPLKPTARPIRTIYSSLLTSSGPTASGSGGEIIINTSNLRLLDGGSLRAESQGKFSGGNITVNAKVITLDSGGKILTSALGSGSAGNITLNTTDRITISNTNRAISDTFQQVATREGLTEAKIKFGTDNPASGVFADTSTDSSGQGGDLNINTPTLTINNNAQLSVSGKGTGAAGNLTVNANKIRLNQGQITAETNAGEGANITLNDVKLLRLENQSLISAQAFNQANGGNITIKAPNGFIIAFPNQNNDIVANAFQGQGGKIDINALNIFNLAVGNSQQTNTSNDIDASSQFGQSGLIILNTPEVDLSRGLTELPEGLADTSQQIAANCNPGSIANRNSFIATGRGGIPQSPMEPLQPQAETDMWITLNSSPTSNFVGENTTSADAQNPIIEAQGWIQDKNGNISLITQAKNTINSNTIACHKY